MEVKVTTASFEQEVVKSDIPCIVDFWATWCGPCRMLGPVLSEIAEANEGKLKVCKVNVDEEPALAQQFGIMSIPLVILFKDGKPVKQALGYRPRAALEAELGI
ncbi:MAG: thioredoxin [Clostridia bacterium]|nr:thioredoxin [Clostridia bacterium]MCR4576453.1 thioredoxin [Clostridiales bacterium]